MDSELSSTTDQSTNVTSNMLRNISDDNPATSIVPINPVPRCVSPINGAIAPGWKPGQSGNPKGRPSAGASIIEWFNALSLRPIEEVKKVLKDKSAPSAKVMAARRVIKAATDQGRADVILIIEHTNGKAVQRVEQSMDQSAVSALGMTEAQAIEFLRRRGAALLAADRAALIDIEAEPVKPAELPAPNPVMGEPTDNHNQ